MMLTGRIVRMPEAVDIGLAQYGVEAGGALDKALALAEKIAGNTRMTNFAVMHALPRIAEAGYDQGSLLESLMASIAQSAPEAKERLELFLTKRARRVGEP
jgi:enoyl-CoA hydratase/carnithine racemase